MTCKALPGWAGCVLSLLLLFFFMLTTDLASADSSPSPPLSIGLSLPLSGNEASHAGKWLQGMSAAVADINRSGGVHGRTLRILALDDAGNSRQRQANLAELTEKEKVFALFGAFGPLGTRETLLHAQRTSTLFFGSSTGLRGLSTPQALPAFSIRPDVGSEAETLVHRFIDETGKNRISVFYGDDVHGAEYLDAVRSALEKKRLTVHRFASPDENSDTKTAAQRLLSSKPDAIVISAPPEITANFIRNIRENDGTIVLLVVSHADPIALADTLMNRGLGVVLSQAVPFPYYRRIPAVNAYAAAVDAFKKEDPTIEMDFPGFEAYLNVRAFAHILRQSPSPPAPPTFIQTAYKQFEVDLGGFRFSFSENRHAGSEEIYLIQIAPGGFVSPIRSFSELYAFHP